MLQPGCPKQSKRVGCMIAHWCWQKLGLVPWLSRESCGDQHPSWVHVKSMPWGGAAGGARFEPSELLRAQKLRVTQATAGQLHLTHRFASYSQKRADSGNAIFRGISVLGLCKNLF